MPERVPRWADALWLALLTIYILAGTAIVPFHGDESTLIYMGRDFHYLFVEGELSTVLYDKAKSRGRVEQRLRLENGTISKTIYGWLASNQGFGLEDLNEAWHWGRDFDFNAGANRVPDRTLLNAARTASAIQLALASILFFQFVQISLNRPTAYLASALFVLHPNVLINGRRAMMEGSHLLGLMLVLLAGAWLLRERKWWTYVLFGACMGIAVAAKHPNVIVCALVFLALLLAAFVLPRRKSGQVMETTRRERAAFALPLVIAAVVFLLLNPAWWSAPLEVPGVIVQNRIALLQVQAANYGGYHSFAEQTIGFFRYVFSAEHQYFEVAQWAEFEVIGDQINAYERSGLAGLMIGGTKLAGIAALLLALFGMIDLARNSAVAAESRLLLLVWIVGSALTTLLLTPLPWARYYLPLAPALALLAAHAILTLASSLQIRANSRADDIDELD